jgi:2-oxoglutarate/2-oxoacid ferredoxin oxidoreductase subunit beta
VASLLDPKRPAAFCPGCAHERSLHALDWALVQMGLKGTDVVMVSDIGCSGLFDTFFETHAFHGLHGRALTYAAGIKLARPGLKVIVTMGDGGIGIGGAHFLEACRRNLDLTLLVLNNFNFGMTGGQFSCTTPSEASVASGFLNRMERPLDIGSVAAAAGAPFVNRCSVYGKELSAVLAAAIAFEGFSVVDVWGPCTGRFTRRNPMKPRDIEERLGLLPPLGGPVPANLRPEYGSRYREQSRAAEPPDLHGMAMQPLFEPSVAERRDVVFLGAAGDRVISTGTLLAHAAVLAGMQVTQKSDYNVTVMRGPSVSDLILSPEPIAFTEVEQPNVIIAVAPEGVARRRGLFAQMPPSGRLIVAEGVEVPSHRGRTGKVDFAGSGIKKSERALAALLLLAQTGDPVTVDMLEGSLARTLSGKALEDSCKVLDRVRGITVHWDG